MWKESSVSNEELHQFLLACKKAGFAPESFRVRVEQAEAWASPQRVVTVSRGRRAISVADRANDRWLKRAIRAVSTGMLGRPAPPAEAGRTRDCAVA